jgi:hypothetical protein
VLTGQRIDAGKLAQQHNPEAIRRRLDRPLRGHCVQDAVLGAIDGCVTTFAIIAAAHAAGLPSHVTVLLGLANLLADALSMAVSNYNAVHTVKEEIESARRTEHSHIEHIPEGEREEIRQIFAAKGFDGDALEHIVNVITSDRKIWIDTMLREELGLQSSPAPPLRASIATFGAFLIAGSIPLALPRQRYPGSGDLLYSWFAPRISLWSASAENGRHHSRYRRCGSYSRLRSRSTRRTPEWFLLTHG